ncbi:MAG: ATP-binding protein [Deltaproteobacteria bacterium]|nr:ATP-binding protein [Deltaproteobacteria bacterium]
MKEIVVISGKGGTGKTSLVAAFACLADRPVLADCDVDAADLYLVLEPHILRQEDFSGGKQAKIISERCDGCGICMEVCRFDAVKKDIHPDNPGQMKYIIDPIACEGCGVCVYFCPQKAIDFDPPINGKWFISDTRVGPMVHARLGIAEENSGKLVTLVRSEARRIAEENGHPYLLVDGPPGIGCPVIASITGADLVVVVTEPTVSGEHDLDRVHKLSSHFGVPTVVCINKHDINPEVTERIFEESRKNDMPVVGKIRYDNSFTKAQIMKSSVIEYTHGPVVEDVKETWAGILGAL